MMQNLVDITYCSRLLKLRSEMGRFKEEIMETVQTFEFTSFEH